MTTRNAIISLLRKERLTAAELAVRLDVTRNAVIVPLRQLEAEGILEGGERKAKRVGKPALEYRVVSGMEDINSGAYPSFAQALVEALPAHLPADQVEALMHKVGSLLAADVQTRSGSCVSDRLKAATDFLDRLGAETIVEKSEEGPVVRSFSCPLGRAVRQQPCVCGAVETFLSEVTGAKVQERCDRTGELRCEFLIKG